MGALVVSYASGGQLDKEHIAAAGKTISLLALIVAYQAAAGKHGAALVDKFVYCTRSGLSDVPFMEEAWSEADQLMWVLVVHFIGNVLPKDCP